MKLQVATLILSLRLISSFSSSVVNGLPNTDINTEECSIATYAPGDPYGNAVNQALNDVLSQTPNSDGYVHSIEVSGGDNGFDAMAVGTCQTYLTQTDCATCIQTAFNDVNTVCNGHLTGSVSMVDCFIGYGPIQHQFF